MPPVPVCIGGADGAIGNGAAPADCPAAGEPAYDGAAGAAVVEPITPDGAMGEAFMLRFPIEAITAEMSAAMVAFCCVSCVRMENAGGLPCAENCGMASGLLPAAPVVEASVCPAAGAARIRRPIAIVSVRM